MTDGRKASISGIHQGIPSDKPEDRSRGLKAEEDTRSDNEEDAPGADARVETRRHAGAYAT